LHAVRVQLHWLSFHACLKHDAKVKAPSAPAVSTPHACAAGTTSVLATLGLSTDAGGWLGVGVPSTPGHMLGATAFIVKACATCPFGGCCGQDWGEVWAGRWEAGDAYTAALEEQFFLFTGRRPVCQHDVGLTF